MLKIENVTVKYGENTVLDNFSCDLTDHAVTALFGKSGCGKTTLLNVIAGIVKADSGSVRTELTPVYMFQEPRLFPWLSALENVNLVLSDTKKTQAVAKEYLDKTGMTDYDKYPAELSGGMQQRVALARTLAGAGDLLLLDEPFSALDKESKEKLIDLVIKDGRKVVFVTHDTADLEFADHIIYL